MVLKEFIELELGRLHELLEKAVQDLSAEQWHALPSAHPEANNIAFQAWHCVRTEDNIVRFVLQGRRPTVWMEEAWAEKLSLPAVVQGTGMVKEEAQAIRIKDIEGFKQYMDHVRESTEEYLGRATESELASVVMVKPLGELEAIYALGRTCLTHLYMHLGEIELTRTLLGLKPAMGE